MKKTMLFVLAMLASFVAANGVAEGDDGGAQVNNGAVNNPFSTFYKREQLRLLTLLDSTISNKTEDALTQNFNAVKKADINFQSKLGGRAQNIGVNVIGSFIADDSKAFGWQLRAFGGEDDTSGGNAGLFLRRIYDNTLIGANAFADYEDGNDGNFTRVGFGGELQVEYFSLAANYYAPITDDKKINMTVAAFSREGYDAKLRVHIPQSQAFNAVAEYYNFDGKEATTRQEGFRFGAEAHLYDKFKLGIVKDSEDDQFGIDIAYSHTFGEAHSRNNNNTGNFAPDLFAPVSREYSQRIATVAISTPPAISQRNTSFAFGVHVPVATILLEGGAIAGNLPAGFAITANTIILFSASAVGQSSHALTITSAAHTMTASLALTHVPPVLSNIVATSRMTNTMTIPQFTTTMTVRTTTTMTMDVQVTNTTRMTTIDPRERQANVRVTFYLPNYAPLSGLPAANFVLRTRANILVTLPPATTPRPWVVSISSIPRQDIDIVSSSNPAFSGFFSNHNRINPNSPATVVEGSEQLLEPLTMVMTTTETTTTMTVTETTMTTFPETITPEMTTSATMTTFVTTTITTNIAAHTPAIPPMLEMPPMLSPMPKMAIMPPMPPMPQPPQIPVISQMPKIPPTPKIAMADIPIIRHSIIPSFRHSPIPSFPRRRESRNHSAQSAA